MAELPELHQVKRMIVKILRDNAGAIDIKALETSLAEQRRKVLQTSFLIQYALEELYKSKNIELDGFGSRLGHITVTIRLTNKGMHNPLYRESPART